VEQLYFYERLGVDRETVQPVGFEDAELLQARAPCLRDSVTEVAWDMESDAAQGEVGELVKDALGREGKAFIP